MLDAQHVRSDRRSIARLGKILAHRQDIITFWAIVAVSVVSIAVFALLLIVVLL